MVMDSLNCDNTGHFALIIFTHNCDNCIPAHVCREEVGNVTHGDNEGHRGSKVQRSVYYHVTRTGFAHISDWTRTGCLLSDIRVSLDGDLVFGESCEVEAK